MQCGSSSGVLEASMLSLSSMPLHAAASGTAVRAHPARRPAATEAAAGEAAAGARHRWMWRLIDRTNRMRLSASDTRATDARSSAQGCRKHGAPAIAQLGQEIAQASNATADAGELACSLLIAPGICLQHATSMEGAWTTGEFRTRQQMSSQRRDRSHADSLRNSSGGRLSPALT